MRKKTPREARESALASGWTVEADPAPESAAPPEAAPETAPGPKITGAEAEPAAENAAGSAAADGTAAGADEPGADAGPRPQLSNGALVLLGVTGGLYLLYAWIWLSWAQYYAGVNAEQAATSGSLGAVLQQIVFWAAPLAPILWFLAALWLNRGRGLRWTALWIAIGAVVLVPLPLFLGGAA
ncbi:hypothetical protein [Leucobacter massiliensis]|uniref:DNA polymerase III subunit gamma/tau n=1 Tax=Leucobacter massiliensis TaxID=1686285 RepID=A0A2S9QMB4_9MICO|nr:hypothetical protein [Leucobacter massiliensis]PRI10721.1 hypothetical protein B4915_07415 [Leucobacter massiliensis]